MAMHRQGPARRGVLGSRGEVALELPRGHLWSLPELLCEFHSPFNTLVFKCANHWWASRVSKAKTSPPPRPHLCGTPLRGGSWIFARVCLAHGTGTQARSLINDADVFFKTDPNEILSLPGGIYRGGGGSHPGSLLPPLRVSWRHLQMGPSCSLTGLRSLPARALAGIPELVPTVGLSVSALSRLSQGQLEG